MPRDGQGGVTRTDGTRTGADVWGQAARTPGVLVNARDHDAHDQDLADMIAGCLARDGQNSPTADLPMAGRKHTGAAAAAADDEYATLGQLLVAGIPFVDASDVGGTANAITLTPAPAAAAYETGRGYRFIVQRGNTGPVTVAVSGLAPVSLRDKHGDDLPAGALEAGEHVVVIHDGQKFLSDVHEHDGIDDAAVNALIAAASLGAGQIGSGVMNAARLAANPAANKVLTATDGAGGSSWIDPFSVSRPAVFIKSGVLSAKMTPAWPRSQSALQEFQYRIRNVTDGGVYGAPIAWPAGGAVAGLAGGKQYNIQIRARNADGWCQWSLGRRAEPFAESDHLDEVAGQRNFVWPWPQSKARVLVVNGTGGVHVTTASFGGTTISGDDDDFTLLDRTGISRGTLTGLSVGSQIALSVGGQGAPNPTPSSYGKVWIVPVE